MKLTRPNEVGNRPVNTCSREGIREREPAAGSANSDRYEDAMVKIKIHGDR